MDFARFYGKIQNICPFFERNAPICALSGRKISRDLPVAMADKGISAQEQAVSNGPEARFSSGFAGLAVLNLAKFMIARVF
ncbi:hypothetical protein KUV62_09375 [Salipiger bermudensis]|uniref:hypothetical protein n=1 Tax=Salipiger bermudensis TaxID=344736 RepID=UPI001C99B33D|nr:hypothetical protein [Salipiger bermudensis]MBY6004117.1 hypothetical protein [Salipiger bermudensis]